MFTRNLERDMTKYDVSKNLELKNIAGYNANNIQDRSFDAFKTVNNFPHRILRPQNDL